MNPDRDLLTPRLIAWSRCVKFRDIPAVVVLTSRPDRSTRRPNWSTVTPARLSVELSPTSVALIDTPMLRDAIVDYLAIPAALNAPAARPAATSSRNVFIGL